MLAKRLLVRRTLSAILPSMLTVMSFSLPSTQRLLWAISKLATSPFMPNALEAYRLVGVVPWLTITTLLSISAGEVGKPDMLRT